MTRKIANDLDCEHGDWNEAETAWKPDAGEDRRGKKKEAAKLSCVNTALHRATCYVHAVHERQRRPRDPGTRTRGEQWNRRDGGRQRIGQLCAHRVFAITRMLHRTEIGDLSLLARLSVPGGGGREHASQTGKIDGESLVLIAGRTDWSKRRWYRKRERYPFCRVRLFAEVTVVHRDFSLTIHAIPASP